MAKTKNRRRQLFVDELQIRLLSINVAYFAVILGIFTVSLFTPMIFRLIRGSAAEAEQLVIAEQFLYLSETIWLPLLFTFLALGAHSVLVSHRIAGPLYQIRRLLRAVADGNLAARAVLRDKDYLKKEEAVVNEMIEKLGSLIEDVDARAYEMRTTVQQLKAALDAGSTADARTYLNSLDANAESLDASLSKFKTRPEDFTGEAPEAAPAPSA